MYEIRPSKEIWNYYQRNGVVGELGITIDLIVSALADINYGFHISYSATELLKDLGLLSPTGRINKVGRYVLAIELHERYHRKSSAIYLVDPYKDSKEVLAPLMVSDNLSRPL